MFRSSFYSKKYCWKINSPSLILTWQVGNFQAVCLYQKNFVEKFTGVRAAFHFRLDEDILAVLNCFTENITNS